MKPPFTPAFLLVFFQIEGIQDPLFHGQLHQLRQCLLIVLDLDAVAVPEGLQGIDHIGLVVQGGEAVVKQIDLGVLGNCPGNGKPLLLTATL